MPAETVPATILVTFVQTLYPFVCLAMVIAFTAVLLVCVWGLRNQVARAITSAVLARVQAQAA